MDCGVSFEFKECDFGDSRLTQRIMTFSNNLRNNPQVSINAACGSSEKSKAAYRLLENEKVTCEKILSSHVEQTLERIKEIKDKIILIQDTTTISCTYPSTKNLGTKCTKPGYKDGIKGVDLHTSFAVSSGGVPLGIMEQTYFTYDKFREDREQTDRNVKGINKKFPITQKSSKRWIDHLISANIMAKNANIEFIHVADRECDIYEFLQKSNEINAAYVVRSSVNRTIFEGKGRRKSRTLEEKLKEIKPISEIFIERKTSHGVCEEHKCEVKHLPVELFAPFRVASARVDELKNLPINIVEVKEINNNKKDKLHWKLLTNLPCKTMEDILEIIRIYKLRWSIECFHRILLTLT